MDGGVFREARESAGLSLEELSHALDVREEYLEALERGELGLLLGPSYVESIAVRYAVGVGMDPEQALSDAAEVPEPPHPSDDRPDSGWVAQGRRSLHGGMSSLGRPVLVALLLAAVVVATLAVLESTSVISLTEAISASTGRTVTTVGVPVAVSTTSSVASTTTTTDSTTATTTTATSTGASTATTAVGGFVVVFAPLADLWLEVTDQKTGKVIFAGLRTTGERLKLPFSSPAYVRVGRPEALKVSFNGRVVKTPTALEWSLSSKGIAPAQ
jgi:cytoskeletal protein RodZ